MKKRFLFSLLFGVLVSAGSLYIAFKNVSLADIVQSVLNIDAIWIIPTAAAVLFSFVLRSLRWKLILRTVKTISFRSAYHPIMIGFMLNCVLPARAGEIARPIVLKELEEVPFSTGLASVAAERIFDILVILVFFTILFNTVTIDPDMNIVFGKYHLNRALLVSLRTSMIRIGIVVIILMILISSKAFRQKLDAILSKIPAILFKKNELLRTKAEQKVFLPIIRMIHNIGFGFSIIKNPADITICFILSILIWMISALSYYFLSLGFPGLSLNFMEIFIYMIIICFFIALPSAPGYWGLWEAGGVFALMLFGIPAAEAASFTLANHVIQFLPVIIAGIISMIVTGFHIKQFIFWKRSSIETSD